jgi:hypothetical protein
LVSEYRKEHVTLRGRVAGSTFVLISRDRILQYHQGVTTEFSVQSLQVQIVFGLLAMEVFGVVAGGVSLLELVAKSLLLLAKHTRKAKQANVERLQIIEQINKFYGLLLDATALLNDGEDGEDSSFLDNAQLCSLRKVLDEKGRTVEELKRHLEGLLDKLVSNVNQQGLKGVVLKVMWPLDEVEVRATIKIMEALQGQIGTALSIDTKSVTYPRGAYSMLIALQCYHTRHSAGDPRDCQEPNRR